jgi:alpha-D-ribose 1-methylphosphonate 5-triphosphate synthase subunit PhnH
MATVIRVELDETVEQTAQVTLTSLCESHLANTAAMPITLFSICNQEDPMWKQRLEAMSNLEGPRFHAGMVALAKYVQHMYNMQATEELRQENAILHSGTLPPSDQDRELHVTYRHLSEAEHGWHSFRQQLDAACKVLDDRTHVIIYLEHHIEQQDLELEERAAMITALKQQL